MNGALKISVSAFTAMAGSGKAGSKRTGHLEGAFSVGSLRLWVSCDLGSESPMYAFQIAFRDVLADAVTITHAVPAADGTMKTHQALQVTLTGITLGAALEYLVNLVAPTLGFHLEPPWDVLKRIELSRFTLTVDPTEQTVEIAYTVGADILAMRVDKVGVLMRRVRGRPSVELVLEGRFLNKEYGGAKPPLSWDVISGDPPPVVPGAGSRLLELRYIGIGNHIAFTAPAAVTSVQDALAKLRAALTPPTADTVAPLPKPAAAGSTAPAGGTTTPALVRYSKDAGYMLGLDVRLMGTVDLAIIFNDPVLYGLAIGLAGERAGPLAGLKFEILYKKISDTVGVFSVSLELPSAFRHVELGEVSLTIGTVVVDIYTNGDFRVDLGFPRLRDFSSSFAVQALPFIGRGGVYFAKLSAATARDLPKITNGTFSPVLALGIGLAVGVGKDVTFGPVSGTAYLQVEIVFEGVLAWFNPSAAGVPAAKYYAARGMAALHGRVSAELRWLGATARINFEAYAQVSVTAAAYQPMLFRLSARVQVEAELDIGWWGVSFSHAYDVDISVEIGSRVATPWVLAPGESALPKGMKRDLAAPSIPLPDMVRWQHLANERRRRADAPAASEDFTWAPGFKAFAELKTVPVQVTPVITLTNVPFAWGTQAPANIDPIYRAAYLMLAETGTAAAAQPAQGNATPAPAKSFDILAEAMLRWALGIPASTDSATVITSGRVISALAWLQGPGATALTYDLLADLVAGNFRFDIWCRDIQAPQAEAPRDSFMVVPPPPPFTFTVLSPTKPLGSEAVRRSAFRDWYLALAQHVVQAARDEMACWRFEFQDPTDAKASTLGDIAGRFPSTTVSYDVKYGDTIESVAEALGTTAAELDDPDGTLASGIAAGPSETPLEIKVGVTPELVALTNADVPLRVKTTLSIRALPYTIVIGDTLDRINASFFPPPREGPVPENRLLTHLANDDLLLRAGATLPASPPQGLSFGAELKPSLRQALFFVRYSGIVDVPYADRYVAMLTALNPGAARDGQFPDQGKLKLPLSLQDETTVLDGYLIQPGDTVLGLASSLALAIEFDGDDTIPGWAGYQAACARDPAVPIASYSDVLVKPRETLLMLAQRITFSDTIPSDFGSRAILDPLHVISLPDVPHSVADDETIGSIAALYGMKVGDLAGSIKEARGLFPNDAQLRVHHLLAQTAGKLIDAVLGGPARSRIAAQMSRQLLGGLRLPATDATAQQSPGLVSLLDLIGQQVDIAASNLDVAGLAQQQLRTYLADDRWVRSTADHVFSLLSSDLTTHAPATSFSVPGGTPDPMPLVRSSQRAYGLDRYIAFQAAGAEILFGGNRSPLVMPTIWPMPAALREKAKAAVPPHYKVFKVPVGGNSAEAVLVGKATFGSMISLRIRRLADVEGIYELIGAAAEHRHNLLALSTLADAAAQPGDKAYLLAAPAPDARDPHGLSLLIESGAEEDLVILQTNLSTYTVESGEKRRDTGKPPSRPHSAHLSQVRAFLGLLWEGSTVGGRGYYLAGKTLRASLFDANGTAELTLLVVLSHQRYSASRRQPNATDNCVIIEESIDAGSTALYLEASDDPDDLVRQAIVPPGRVGFTLTIDRPRQLADDSQDPQVKLRQMFSQLTYAVRVPAGAVVPADVAAPHPISPLADDGRSAAAVRRTIEKRDSLRVGRSEPATSWRYEEIIDSSVYGPPPQVGDKALPDPAKDPYRCVGKSIDVDFGFVDVFGNTSRPPKSDLPLNLPVHYTDPLVPVSAWPTVGLSYTFFAGEVTTLTVTAVSDGGFFMPGPDDSPDKAIAQAADLAKRYSEIYYQVSQPDVTASIETTLAGKASHTVLVDELSRLAADNYLYAMEIASLLPVRPAAQQETTLQDVVDTYGVSIDAIARANLDVPLSDIFGSGATLTLPIYAVFAEGDTADSIAKANDFPGSGMELLQQRRSNNFELPKAGNLYFRADTVLRIPEVSIVQTYNKYQPPAVPSLAYAAGRFGVTPGLIAADNPSEPLLPDLPFEADGVVITTSAIVNTLSLLVAKFSEVGVHTSPADLVQGRESDVIFARDPRWILSHHYRPKYSRSCADISIDFGGVGGAFEGEHGFESLNASVPNIFPNGTPVWIKDVSANLAREGGTLREVAMRYGLPPTTLFASQLSTSVVKGAPLVVPGALALPADTGSLRSLTTPTSPQSAMSQNAISLAAAAAQLQVDTKVLARCNRAVIGLMSVNRRRSFPNLISNAADMLSQNDTLNNSYVRSVSQSSNVDFDSFIDSIKDVPLLNPSALLFVPPRPAVLSTLASATYSSLFFPLHVDLTIQRQKELVYPALQSDQNAARIATSSVPPWSATEQSSATDASAAGKADASSRSLRSFAATFHDAFPSLRLATGKIDEDATDLWVVAFDAIGIETISVTPSGTFDPASKPLGVYAIRPVATELVTRDRVKTQELNDDGTLGTETTSTIQHFDAEVWARTFLIDLERFLSGPYAVGADRAAPEALTDALDAKATLAGVLANGLTPVLANATKNEDALLEARERLRQRAAANLLRGYETSAVVQLETSITSTGSTGHTKNPPRLVGRPIPVNPEFAYTLSDGKLPLQMSAGYMSFLLDLNRASWSRGVADTTVTSNASLKLDMDLAFRQLEVDIEKPIPDVEYEASNWLTIIDAGPADENWPHLEFQLRDAQVPIPMRAYPDVPILLSQSATSSIEKPKLEETKLWAFTLSYAHLHAPQDVLHLAIETNIEEATSKGKRESTGDLVDELAAYAAVADDLWAQLSELVLPDVSATSRAAKAAATFSEFVTRITPKWDEMWRSTDGTRAARTTPNARWRYELRSEFKSDAAGAVSLNSMVMTAVDTATPSEASWPLLSIQGMDGVPIDLGQGQQGQNDKTRIYALPAKASVPSGRLAITLSWRSIDVLVDRNARASIHVERNADLLAGETTAQAFIYRTPTIRASNAVTPTLTWTDLPSLSLNKDLPTTLAGLFSDVFAETNDPAISVADLTITMDVSYAFPLTTTPGGDESRLYSTLPAVFFPSLLFKPTSPSERVDTSGIIASELAQWLGRHNPPTAGGRWLLSFTVRHPNGGPLLSISNLRVALP